MNDQLYSRFINPPLEYWPIPKWIWNVNVGDITNEGIREQLESFNKQDKYGGVMIVLWDNDHYMDELFFEKIHAALTEARRLGLKIIIWDENGFPSGFAGGLVELKYPQYMAKRLDMLSEIVKVTCAQREYVKQLPSGQCIGAVAMNTDTYERTDITREISGSVLRCTLGHGNWNVMLFHIVTEDAGKLAFTHSRLIDYLSEEAVNAFIECTHQAYYNRFSEYFGDVIEYFFYDEPTFFRVEGGRMWTGDFNEVFAERYGYSPVTLYPALFMDIGKDTPSARNSLLSLRADLYADRYVARLSDWCEKHGVRLTGHMEQEEIRSPVSISGDLMKVMRGQHMPGIDEIRFYNRASAAYKILSSAAYNFDKPAVMCEVFGAMGADMPVEWLLKEYMDQLAKGVSFFIPHGTWYDAVNNVIHPPELSFRTSQYAQPLAAANEYAARATTLLRGGRHVCDIGVLYPIEDLQAGYFFTDEIPYLGGRIPDHTDYLELGELLSLSLRKDFTYLHPEVIYNKCKAMNGRLYMSNDVNYESYSVVILPSIQVIGAGVLHRLTEFVQTGGALISAGLLPSRSSEHGCDREVLEMVDYLFPAPVDGLPFAKREYGNKGFTYLLNINNGSSLASALEDCGLIFDLTIPSIATEGGNFTYIHKHLDGREVFFFANSSDNTIDTEVSLRGNLSLETWDPHTGHMSITDFKQEGSMTRLHIKLPPMYSSFYVGIEE